MILITADWCVNCKPIKEYVAEKQYDVTLVDADENREYIRSIGVRSVPTLIDGDKIFVGADSIKNYLEGSA